MAHIRWSTDVDTALTSITEKENLNLSEVTELEHRVKALLQHPDLMDYFMPGQQVLNEREIFDENDVILRPDRVNLSGNSAVVIDYKTGKPETAHKSQIQSYGNALNKMGYTVEKQILIYLIDGGVTLDFV
jgi:CRISPR/Cas system-associated exonuclease Cas4 (RecB family)